MSNTMQIVDCNLSGFSVHGILQAKILEWVAISSTRESSWPRDQTCVSYIPALTGGFFTISTTQEAQWQFRICHTLKVDMGEHWFGPYLLFCSISPSYHRMAHFAKNLDSRETAEITSGKKTSLPVENKIVCQSREGGWLFFMSVPEGPSLGCIYPLLVYILQKLFI